MSWIFPWYHFELRQLFALFLQLISNCFDLVDQRTNSFYSRTWFCLFLCYPTVRLKLLIEKPLMIAVEEDRYLEQGHQTSYSCESLNDTTRIALIIVCILFDIEFNVTRIVKSSWSTRRIKVNIIECPIRFGPLADPNSVIL